MSNLEKKMREFEKPGLHLVAVQTPSKSHLGGNPNLPPDIPWPEWNGKKLAFLARISLSELQSVGSIKWLPSKAHRIKWLPKTGALLFFYEVETQPWGFAPEHRGSCRVLHVPDLDEPASTSEAAGDVLPCIPLGFREIETYLTHRYPEVKRKLTYEELGEYDEMIASKYRKLPMHLFGGHPNPIQSNDMPWECQLAWNGINHHNRDEVDSPRGKELEKGAADWQMLLQLDSDNNDERRMWGDCGMIYFLVRAQEATVGNFDNAWLILQSY